MKMRQRISNRLSYELDRARRKTSAAFDAKIFCISMQRTGTTSVGAFFDHFGYEVATWGVQKRNRWTKLWFNGQLENIFRSFDFKTHNVFEDNPWWCGEFYRLLYHRFPKSSFVLFERDPDLWFDSMVRHSDGQTLGNTYRHSVEYNRNDEFYEKLGHTDHMYTDEIDNLMSLKGRRNHYTRYYSARNRRVADFFRKNDPSRLVHLQLEDELKWKKLGAAFNIDVPDGFEVHKNASS